MTKSKDQLVSVVVPAYGVEDYLNRCIDSILMQSNESIEVVLVDDGSLDRSGLICDESIVRDSRIVVVHRPNGGLLSTRVVGVMVACGQSIMFVDGDDWVEPRYVEACFNTACCYGADLVCCDARTVYCDHIDDMPVNAEPGVYNRYCLERTIFPYLVEDDHGKRFDMSVWGKCFRRDKLLKAYEGVDTRITFGEDAVVVRPYIYHCDSMVVLRDCLYNYNKANTLSMTGSRKPLPWMNSRLVYERQLDVFEGDEAMLEQVRRNYIHNLFFTAITQFSSEKSYFETSRHIREQLSQKDIQKLCKKISCKSLSLRIAKLCLCYRQTLLMWFIGRLYR